MRAAGHNERCRDCKEEIENLLATMFDDVQVNYDISLPARLEEYLDAKGLAKRGQFGSAMPRNLVGTTPTEVIVSHEPRIEPCGVPGNGWADA